MLTWNTDNTLRSINEGFVSELSVSATQSLSISEIKYRFESGSLPAGLEFKHDGTIVGRTNYGSTGTYTFNISAIDIANSEISTQTFNLTVVSQSSKKYTTVYFKPLLNLEKRKQFRNFINNEQIFQQSLMYRYHDLNFGVQRNLKMVLDFGVEQLNLEEYLYPLYEAFYRKRLRLGTVKTAIANNENGNHIYDVIYVDVIDELAGVDLTVNFTANDELYYPASIDNMKKQFQSITLSDWSNVGLNENLQPKYMLTSQDNDTRVTSYMQVVPLCYTLPGKSNVITTNIKNSGFKFNILDFEIDRVYVEQSLDNAADKYLLFERNNISDLLLTDQYLLGPEGWIRLDDESDQPLERE